MPGTNHGAYIEMIQNEVIAEFSKTLEMFDLTPAEARLFVTLYINQAPMTLDEMSDALGKSKTSMSTGIRSLLDLNLVDRVWKKGVRKDLYQAKEDLYRKFMNAFLQKWLDAADRQKQSLEEIEQTLQNEHDVDGIKPLQKRIDDMIEFHQLIEKTFKSVKPNGRKTL
ncbi:GbsR/MarR family transcriptional regulator [Salirhabdus salicampi]|uniref:GbsR/MarR family transcriptional regulator n=1 Tax=Salirhabdus salicampi TaxID=476102 RepID=UPI0020C51E6A|nr:helix-turn-helix domain-containing protein [Salirhabdus salicampi]MCP8615507.1 transcriptional regulator [Salirhabdus salicampi]